MDYANYHQHTAETHGRGQKAIHLRPEEKTFPHIEKRSRQTLHSILGIKMNRPTMTAVIAAISTAPAARSLMILILGFLSRVTMSASRSTAVLSSSVIQTRPVTIVSTAASVKET